MDAIPPFVFLVLVLALLAMAAGLVIWLANYMRGNNVQDSKPSHTVIVEEEPATPAGVQEPLPANISRLQPAGTQELLSVRRMEESGELAVFARGRRYDHLREIGDRQTGQDAVEAIKCVLTFAEGLLPVQRPEPSQPIPTQPAADAEAFLEQLRQSDLFPLERKPPGMFDSLVKRRAQHSADDLLLTPADAINNIVQRRLKERPDLARHNIRLTTSQDGGLCFRVGARAFAAVEEIPDPEIRSFVEDAIQEWRES